MGQTTDDKREIFKGIRFTKEEWETIQENMQREDYLSFSKYVRHLVLDRKISQKTKGYKLTINMKNGSNS